MNYIAITLSYYDAQGLGIMLKNNKWLLFYVIFCVKILMLAGCVKDISAANYAGKPVTTHNKINVKLQKALELVFSTDIGQSLKSDIEELLLVDKIQLVYLHDGHYGETGEGCVIKNGLYRFEGYYIDLNHSLTVSMLAISLVHEATHYQMIKKIVNEPDSPSMLISMLEVHAFANQFLFMQELQALDLIDPRLFFSGEENIVKEIMEDAYRARQNWSNQAYETVKLKLIQYGYPMTELNRKLLQKQKYQCVGSAFSDL